MNTENHIFETDFDKNRQKKYPKIASECQTTFCFE